MANLLNEILYGQGISGLAQQNNFGAGAFNPDVISEIPTPVAKQRQPEKKSPWAALERTLDNPLLANILAQSGYSYQPGPSPIGVIGRAMLATQEQQRQSGMDDIRKRLLESQIGLNEAKTGLGANPTAGNVQSTFKGSNGNMWVFTRGSTTPVDTGVPFDSGVKTQELADGSVVGIDADGRSMGYIVSPEQAKAAADRAAQTEKAQDLPTALVGIQTQIRGAGDTINKIKEVFPLIREDTTGTDAAIRGDLPGIFGGDARTLKRAIVSLQANFGFDTLQAMRAASKSGGALGQVSERELDLLINALEAIDVEGDPNVLKKNLQDVINHYENYVREIEAMGNAMRKEAGKEPVETSDDRFKGFSIATD